ncbi:ATP-binding cassette domain-containing protein [Urbifossiella limnaea]|uniref:Putative ABC transporter ATP-binding protein YlmA n=1 Tax=Urbifossiella limnaea TaxID=2528023 RepID=A0A517XMS0_9BACT|nr:ATP-binding cassette domain-containing protein [Urbifossiella limnaea]QDU18809.1 putative ABC transporter ATP-binding protein YlmA [Urbifossiella limnaea]
MTEPVFALDRATVARPGGAAVLTDFSWTVREGETWAVTGPVGCGKSTLADALLGRIHLRAGDLTWPLLDRLRAAGRDVKYVSDVARHVPFQENSRLFSYAGHYYQQRFEFADADEPLSLGTFLRSGSPAPADEVAAVAARLGLADRLGQPFITLSNGQTRRARIARALLGHPELLVLDDPFLGLDAAGRADVAAFLGRLVGEGLRLVLVCAADAVPGWVSNKLTLGRRDAGTQGQKDIAPASVPQSLSPSVPQSLSPIIELRDVTVRHGGRVLLDDVTWTVRAGERWAVMGPNGSGKTTLLSLLCGDHPQAFSNDVRLFGRRRGTGERIWDVKRPVGLTSPEFHLYFTGPLTAARAAATGFFDGVTDHATTPEQDAMVAGLFADFGLGALAARPFRQLSTGEQKLVLLARALVKRPRLVILDEPFQSFDADTVARCRDWLDANLSPDQTLLFVSHHPPELPRTVTRTLRLDNGRATAE